MNSNSEDTTSSSNKETDIFEFETESLALKGNRDYVLLAQCLTKLIALRSQALNDIDTILQLEEDALADPSEFIRKLKNGEDIGVPMRLNVPKIPDIDWSKYKWQPSNDDLRPVTRPKQRESFCFDKKPDSGRTRPKPDQEKPASFNQLWTAEEQLKLEELLVKYPSEMNEARRFAKIAKELGNRTLSQVTSRCQKYFLKLQKAGLPVPGRTPRLRYRELSKNPRAKFHPIIGVHHSTFFPRQYSGVPAIQDGDLPGTSNVDLSYIKSEPVDSEDVDVAASDETRKLNLLRRVRADLTRHSGQPVQHPGFMCNVCKEEPLSGTRWHCLQCNDVDFCSGCVIGQLEDEGGWQHPLTHQLVSYRPALSAVQDKDYAPSTSYLDPSFRPD